MCSKDAQIDQIIPKFEVDGHFCNLIEVYPCLWNCFLDLDHNVTPCFQNVIPWKDSKVK